MPRSVPVVLTLASLGVLSACRPDTGLTKFNSEPEAQITAPSAGAAVLEGTTVTLRGQASDPNHPTTQLLARWFAGDTEACASTTPAADGTTTCDVRVPDGDALAVRLEVLDPEGSAGTAEASYAITPNQAPLASIASPSADGVYYSDQLVVLRATVDDAEDDPASLQVRWESNRDGELGQATPNSEGLVESFVNLTEGAHAVQVFVTDSAGNEGQATVLVEVGPPNTAPGCGITAPTDGGAGVEGARVDFAGAVSDVDIPADRLSVRWTSDKDGDLGASTPDTAGSVAFSTSALSVNTHRITMTVTDEVGATCTTGLTWTVGTPPEVTLETPLPGEVVNEGEGLSFSAIVSDREDVAGDLTVRWESDRDGILHEAAPDSTGVSQFIARDLAAGDHVLTVTVTDSTGLTATTLGTFAVNGIPGAPGISLTPTTPFTDDDLVVRIDTPAVDPEGDPLTYTYAWLRDGVVSAASTSATLPASATTDGEIWAVEVSASDGLATGPLARASVTIANSVPTLASASITPDPARRNDTLTCTASGYRDADGDPDLSTYAWTVNGTAAGTGATLTGPFLVGALVACTVTPNDGKDTGTPVTDSVTIENSLPVVSSVTLTPGTVYTNDTLTANAVSSDPDGDSVSLRYRWFADGVEIVGATGSSLSGALAGSFDRDDVVTVEVTPNDGVSDGASVVSAGVTVRNTAPTAPTIAITPAAPEAGDDLTCSVVTPATDVDGDTISYTFAWDQDGASYAGATSGGTSSTVAGADVGGSETWTCEVTAGDGTDRIGVVTSGVGTPDCVSLTFASGSASAQTSEVSAFQIAPSDQFTITFLTDLNPGPSGGHVITKGTTEGAKGTGDWSITTNGVEIMFNNQDYATLAHFPTASGWSLRAFSYNNGVIAYYEDGSLVGTTSGRFSAASSLPLLIGGLATGYPSGSFADVAFWSTALGTADIAALASGASIPTDVPGLVAWWPLDEGVGTSLRDESGRHFDLTARDATWETYDCSP